MFEYENHSKIFLDIETIPDGESNFEELPTKKEYFKENKKTKEQLKLEVPKSYKKEETIQKWIDEEYVKQDSVLEEQYQKLIDECDAEYKSRSLHSLKGRIFCIAVAINDKPTDIIKYDVNEKIILEQLEAYIDGNLGKDKYHVIWIGKNFTAFDLMFIWHRSIKYGLTNLMNILPTGKWTKQIQDVGDIWNLYQYGKHDKLDDIAKYLGLGGKVGMTGAKVFDYFLANKYDEIHEYCKGDVDLTRKIYYKLNGWNLDTLEREIPIQE